MQRLVSLGMLAALLGGGAMFLKNAGLGDLGQVIDAAQRAAQQGGYAPAGSPAYPGGYAPQPVASAGGAPLPGRPADAAPGYQPAPMMGSPTIKVASFNIQVFGEKKAADPWVMQGLATLVQQFDLVAIQEIRSDDPYLIDRFLSDYVNRGPKRYSRVVGPRLGRTVSKEQYAFVWDTATIQVQPDYIYTVNDPDDLLHREPLVARFGTMVDPQQAFTFILVNTHTDPDEAPQELDALAQTLQAVRRQASGVGEDDVILLGDFNTNVPSSEPYAVPRAGRMLQPTDLRGLAGIAGLYPVVRDRSTNTAGSRLHDNLMVLRGATTEFTGRGGVFDVQRQYNLTREQVARLSDHLPVWGEFSVYESAVPGRVAQQPYGAVR